MNDELKAEIERLRKGIKEIRIYAGDNLPASKGVTIVVMLEKLLKEGRKDV